MLPLALMGLLPVGARVSGEAWLQGAPAAVRNESLPKHQSRENVRKNLVGLSEQEFQKVRGREAAMIFQERR